MTDKEYFDSLSGNWEVKPFLVSKNDPEQAPRTAERSGVDVEKFIAGSLVVEASETSSVEPQ